MKSNNEIKIDEDDLKNFQRMLKVFHKRLMNNEAENSIINKAAGAIITINKGNDSARKMFVDMCRNINLLEQNNDDDSTTYFSKVSENPLSTAIDNLVKDSVLPTWKSDSTFESFCKYLISYPKDQCETFSNLLNHYVNMFFSRGFILYHTDKDEKILKKYDNENSEEFKENNLQSNHPNHRFVSNRNTNLSNLSNLSKEYPNASVELSESEIKKIGYAMVAAIAAVQGGHAHKLKKNMLIEKFDEFMDSDKENKPQLALEFMAIAKAHRLSRLTMPNIFTSQSDPVFNTKSYQAFELDVGQNIIKKLNHSNTSNASPKPNN